MLTDLVVENFQSLRDVYLHLGQLTVVTGHTGSGKSSLVRAAKLVVFNARGTAYISRGAASAKAGIGCRAEDWVVGIERGGRGKDSYRIARNAAPDVQTYTKLAGSVPEDVSRVLRITPLNFAGQFDRPFLLDEAGGQVARVLGELTNVSLLFEAAREANRRRLRLSDRLQDAETKLGELRTDVQRFRGLRLRQAAVSVAEEALSSYQQAAAKLERLSHLTTRRDQAQAALVRLSVPEVPSLAAVEQAQARLTRFEKLLRDLSGARDSQLLARRQESTSEDAAKHAEQALVDVLVEAGYCPTCGQQTVGIAHSPDIVRHGAFQDSAEAGP